MNFNKIFKLRPSAITSFYRKQGSASGGLPELTQVRYHIKRGDYAELNGKDVSFFESVVGGKYVLQEDLEGYNVDFWRLVCGNSKLVLKPGSVQEVSAIMKYCNERKLAICPQGGNTGLAGGAVAVCDEIVLSLQRLNKILNIDEITGILSCEAGCILENLDNQAQELGYVMPLDLGAKASCQIGGNLSTNAGGLRVVRYGNLHGNVLGLEAVLPNGQILDLMSDFKKDNTGYHLKHLLIGSEGTLGIITKVSILCAPAPLVQHVAFIGLNSFDDVLKTFYNSKRYLGEILSSCELIDESSLSAVKEHMKLQSPLKSYPFYMLIETSGSNEIHDMEKINNFVENGMQKGEIVDGIVTGEGRKMQEIWKLRELAGVAMEHDGCSFDYDISLPLREFYSIVDVLSERVGSKATRICGFGHLGDCNLHLSVTCPEFNEELYKLIEPFIYEYTASLKGSISSEHGIGIVKRNYLKYSKSPEAIEMMRKLKKLLDPNGILNPYKVLN